MLPCYLGQQYALRSLGGPRLEVSGVHFLEAPCSLTVYDLLYEKPTTVVPASCPRLGTCGPEGVGGGYSLGLGVGLEGSEAIAVILNTWTIGYYFFALAVLGLN